MTESVGAKLLSEIERVSAKRERWRGYAAENEGSARAAFGPALMMMTAAIDSAKAAFASGDPVEAIQALAALEGFDTSE